MSEQIKDGTGKGYLVEVDNENMLLAKCVSIPHLAHHSRINKKAFTAHMHVSMAAADTYEGIGYIEYTGEKTVFINKILVCTEEVAGMSAVSFYVNPEGLTGGDTLEPTNLNFSSRNTIDATIKHNNDGTAISTTSDGVHFACMRGYNSVTETVNFEDSLILGINDILYIKGKTTTINTLMRCTVFFAEGD